MTKTDLRRSRSLPPIARRQLSSASESDAATSAVEFFKRNPVGTPAIADIVAAKLQLDRSSRAQRETQAIERLKAHAAAFNDASRKILATSDALKQKHEERVRAITLARVKKQSHSDMPKRRAQSASPTPLTVPYSSPLVRYALGESYAEGLRQDWLRQQKEDADPLAGIRRQVLQARESAYLTRGKASSTEASTPLTTRAPSTIFALTTAAKSVIGSAEPVTPGPGVVIQDATPPKAAAAATAEALAATHHTPPQPDLLSAQDAHRRRGPTI